MEDFVLLIKSGWGGADFLVQNRQAPDTLGEPLPIVNGLTSIVLPTYNRATFLPGAIESIMSQKNTRWELIVIDDGSADDTREVIDRLCAEFRDRVRYIRQNNQGSYAARNAGLGVATGEYIAFFDSDDLWLPHHLDDCVAVLEQNPDVDWVYGACRSVDFRTGQVLAPNTFYVNEQPRAFLGLNVERRGRCCVIRDRALVSCSILRGLYCGLQNSVIRRRVFARPFATAYRNEAEDQMFAIRAALAKCVFAYIDNVHVIYRVHEENSSASSVGASVGKHADVLVALVRGYEELRSETRLTATEVRALRRRLNREYFWHLGYALLWQQGKRREALEMFRRGLQIWPWSPACWKTYVTALVRVGVARVIPGGA